MKFSLLCLLIGHKFFNRKETEFYDKDGRKWKDMLKTERKTCARCGEKNPAYIK